MIYSSYFVSLWKFVLISCSIIKYSGGTPLLTFFHLHATDGSQLLPNFTTLVCIAQTTHNVFLIAAQSVGAKQKEEKS